MNSYREHRVHRGFQMNNELFVYWIPGQARNDVVFDCVICG